MTDTVFERKEVPSWITERIGALGGMNQFGRPNYRVIWGGNRTHRVGGKFKDVIYVRSNVIGDPDKAIVTEVADIRTLLKYHPFRWHLERWLPPEAYGTREEWYEQTWDPECGFHTQGDYPAEGDYEHIFYLGMCAHMRPGDTDWCGPCRLTSGEYIPLEENFNIIELQIRAFQMSADVRKADEKVALFKREMDKKQARRKIVEERVRGAMRPVLATQPTSWQDGTRCSVPEASLETLRQLPHTKLGFGQSNKALPNHKQEEIDNGS